jgi:hypothetical protein
MRRLRHLPLGDNRGGGGGLHRRSGTHRPLTRTGSPILLHPNAGGMDFVGGYRVVLWSGFSSGLGLEGDGGGSRGRGRSHYEKRKIESGMIANG